MCDVRSDRTSLAARLLTSVDNIRSRCYGWIVIEIDDIDIRGSEATVTWSDEHSTHTAVLELDWQPAEPDVGIGAGFNVHGEAPQEVLDAVSKAALENREDDFDDR